MTEETHKEYLVEWQIELSATSPQEAANTAWKYMRDPDSQANHFSVTAASDGPLDDPLDGPWPAQVNAQHNPLGKQTRQGHTVILAYPDNTCTYIEFSESLDPQQAVEDVQQMASDDNEGDYEPGEFDVLAIFQGEQIPGWSGGLEK